MAEPVAGKFLLEILTKGMYSNPMHVYREYIQNSTDSIDKAIADGVLGRADAAIHIQIDGAERKITIRDNGCGISAQKVRETLLNIGHSDKNGVDERGFRGIGRLAGLAYAAEVQFITSAYGEPVKTIMTCDCVKMQQLLQKTNTETTDVMETFKAISSFAEPQPEKIDEHYFEVCMIGVPQDSGLLEENDVWRYLAETAPVDFNSQQFSQAQKIRDYFEDRGCPIACYKILRGSRKLPIYKPYKNRTEREKEMRVLLVEPNYKNKYPPMGLMKISTYHKMLGDEVRFVKGFDPEVDEEVWDNLCNHAIYFRF